MINNVNFVAICMSPDHPLHILIGKRLRACISADNEEFEIKFDGACLSESEKKKYNIKSQNLPLFLTVDKREEFQYCNVDELIFILKKSNKKQIGIIIEIEESGINPTKICGKFLTSALSKYYIHENDGNVSIEMAEDVLFIQVIKRTEDLKNPNSNIVPKLENIERSINQILDITKNNRQFRFTNIIKYKMLIGDENEFHHDKGEEFCDEIKNWLIRFRN